MTIITFQLANLPEGLKMWFIFKRALTGLSESELQWQQAAPCTANSLLTGPILLKLMEMSSLIQFAF